MQVSKNAVYAVGVAFVGLIAIIFFLLGRESNRHRTAPPAVGEASRPAATAASEPSAAAPSQQAAISPPMPTRPPVASPTAAAPMPSSQRDAAAVRDYFAKMDAIQTVTGSSDTGEFANKLLAPAMSGDMSGFHTLIGMLQDGVDRARAIPPPAACATYHEHMLGLLADGVTMVKQLEAAMTRHDSNALVGIAASGNAIQARATAVEAEAKTIKTSLGL